MELSPSLAKAAKNNKFLMATSEQCCLPLRKKDDAFLKDGRIGSMSPFFDELTHFSPVSHSYRNVALD